MQAVISNGGSAVANRHLAPDTPELRARWGGFAWTAENAAKAAEIVKRYPEGRQRSAVMPLLDLAQRQVGAEEQTQGWLPLPVMEYVAQYLDMPVIRVVEVATFYFMYNIVPVGRFHVQVCGTTPCMLRGSDDIMSACKARGMKKGHTTADGMWTLTEVECMGNCATAPMVQINDDNYEDLTPERLNAVLDALARGETPKAGTQEPGRHTCEPAGALSSLHAMADANHDYRGDW
jgi:NADH-quinone oxidoreductase subunit E